MESCSSAEGITGHDIVAGKRILSGAAPRRVHLLLGECKHVWRRGGLSFDVCSKPFFSLSSRLSVSCLRDPH